ncbi:hypothetical protein HDV01_005723 [Terramyces sp. JEL0728]|nr:hypothetical protein HDV01_005723 [Terramyces sp. JEL0728]
MKVKTHKRPINAFFRYKRDMKSIIAEKFNVQKNSEIASICATMWESEDPEVKLFYAKETEREYKIFRSRLMELDSKLKIDLSAVPFEVDFTTGFTPSIDQCEPILRFISGTC